MKGQSKNLLATLGYATVAVAAGIGLAASGGVDADAARGQVFKVTETRDQPAKPKKHKSSGPPPMTCEGDQCWWTDLGRPDK